MAKKTKPMTLPAIIRWWSQPRFSFDRGGSFNVELYLKICEIKLKNHV